MTENTGAPVKRPRVHDGNAGTYWRIAWSRDWRDRHPWSIGGKTTPYIGRADSHERGLTLWALGPLALIRVLLRKSNEKAR